MQEKEAQGKLLFTPLSVLQMVCENLADARDFMGYQLTHVTGGMSDAQMEEIAPKYLQRTVWDPDELLACVRIVHRFLPRLCNADIISTVFHCSLEQACEALARLS